MQHIDEGDRELLAQFTPGAAASIRDLCESLGVTETAVRRRLHRLRSLGLISRHVERQGRGRPKHAYRITRAGQNQLADNYAELAQVLWNAIQRLEDSAARTSLVDSVRQSLARRLGSPEAAMSALERVQQLQQRLEAAGFEVDVAFDGDLPVLREHCCPYSDLAADDESICRLEQDVFSDVLGVPVSLTHRCVDGHACCEFEVQLR